ncbi:hypothetical protein JTY60_01555 [symbiont of Argiope bruennichi]|uniref:hypothetical protein n=1 Tax=symbiont of Argiope bruennichi TaxID=2810479 RepID=UPI003DA43088
MKFFNKKKSKIAALLAIIPFLVGCSTSYNYPDITKEKLERYAKKALISFYTVDPNSPSAKNTFLDKWFLSSDISHLEKQNFVNKDKTHKEKLSDFYAFLKRGNNMEYLKKGKKGDFVHLFDNFNKNYPSSSRYIDRDFYFEFFNFFAFSFKPILWVSNPYDGSQTDSLWKYNNDSFDNFLIADATSSITNPIWSSFKDAAKDPESQDLDTFFKSFIYSFYKNVYEESFFNKIFKDTATFVVSCSNYKDDKGAQSCSILAKAPSFNGGIYTLNFAIVSFKGVDVLTKNSIQTNYVKNNSIFIVSFYYFKILSEQKTLKLLLLNFWSFIK